MKNFIKYTSGVLFFLIVGIFFSGHSSALSGSEFNAGRIIDDAVFFNSNSMSVGEIQNFLNGKVACDTNGTKMTGGVTRAQYAASRGVPTTFTCLPQYRENISNRQNNIGNPSYSPPGSMSAAEIIYKVSADHGVSSKALIVLLQKEQALVTDEWPFPRQYQIATGYGCPDTAPCDDQYYGFYNQVNKAAYQFKRYVNNSSAYRYKAGQVNSVLWSPTTSCGASNVFIENGATAALYNYTPYRPNAAALNNLYGTGDGCSAYGNRNFWRYFRDWFGSTNMPVPPYDWDITSVSIYSDQAMSIARVNGNAIPGELLYAKVDVVNTGYRTWPDNTVRLGTSDPRDSSGLFYDSLSWISTNRPTGMVEESIQYGGSTSFSFAIRVPNNQGSLTERYSLVHEASGWVVGNEKVEINLNVKSPTTLSDSTVILSPSSDVDLSISEHKVLLGGGASLYLDSSNGTLVLFSRLRELWRSSNIGNPGSRLVMQSDGNLVIYNSSNVAVWNTGTMGNPGSRLVMQSDGNLVIYNSSNVAVWNTGTMGNPGSCLRLQPDNNLVIRSRYANISDGVKWSRY